MRSGIGQLKTKIKVYCEICGCSHTRKLEINIYQNTKDEIEDAKKQLRVRADKKYTCRICKSIAE